jgi:hypothetical protein
MATSDPHADLGYGAAPPPAPKPLALPELTSEQLRTLRRVQAGSLLDRKAWTLLCLGELSSMRLIGQQSAINPRWVVTPLGVEALERAKAAKR